MPGYIKVYRDLQDNPIWQQKPFSKGQAWIDIIFRCNHVCKKVIGYGNLRYVLRGQFISSNYKLAEAWGWSESSVRAFIKLLISEGMLSVLSTRHYSLYEVTKYCVYQSIEDSELQDIPNAQITHRKRTRNAHAAQNNNDNNILLITKVINNYTDNVLLKNSLLDFIEYRKEIKKPIKTEKTMQAFLNKLDKCGKTDAEKIEVLTTSIANGWQGIFALKNNSKLQQFAKPPNMTNFEQRKDEIKLENLFEDV
jgi:hypothetical protein